MRVYTQKYIPGKAEEERVDDVPQFAIGRAENNFSYEEVSSLLRIEYEEYISYGW